MNLRTSALSSAPKRELCHQLSPQMHSAIRSPPALASPLRSLQLGVSVHRLDTFQTKALVYHSSLSVQGMQVTSPKAWDIVANTLRDNKVRVISQQELSFAKEKGAIIVDIRPEAEYDNGHISDAQNVSIFRLITGWDPIKILRRAGFAFFGVFNGTEANPDFEAQIEAVINEGGHDQGKQTPMVLICQSGGSLEPTSSQKNGKQSRSLIAAYELLKLGYTNISVLKGGFSEWKRNERPYMIAE